MTGARALAMPKPCPCGGEYIVVQRDDRPGELSLMHTKPPCSDHASRTASDYLSWVQARAVRGAQSPTQGAVAKPNRRHRRAQAAVARRAKEPRVTLKHITDEFEKGGGAAD